MSPTIQYSSSDMRQTFQLSSLIPSGLIVENVAREDETVVLTASGIGKAASCPVVSQFEIATARGL